RRAPRTSAATGTSAAGIRALSQQFVAFYFRAPVKAFFRTRVDYLAYARAINPRFHAPNAKWSIRTTTAGLLAHAVQEEGWGVLHRQVLPPLLANVSVGAVLYTSYLQTLGLLHEPSSRTTKRVYPPPTATDVFTAGAIGGGISCLFAAPLDAIQARFKTSEILEGRHRSMWAYSRQKLVAIGFFGVFAGFGLSLARDALGYGAFFTAFEVTKNQAYYAFLERFYGGESAIGDTHGDEPEKVIRPHYILDPAFLLLAGAAATALQQTVVHPIAQIQLVHYNRLESIDFGAAVDSKHPASTIKMMRLYYHAYAKTFEQCSRQAQRVGGWRRWLYLNFWGTTIRQVPSSSAGLIMFEIFRRRFAD
ncbi:mitochondrial carrier, partial [Eremomyces bilateralis CBS 781.70]